LPQPAVAIEQSVAHDYLVCLEDGRKVRMLRRYLAGRYGMSPDEYRQKWGLAADYPMVAPGCAALKRRAARARGERAVAEKVNGQRLRRTTGADVKGGPEPESSVDAPLLSPPTRLIKRDQAVSNGHGDAGPESPVGGTIRGRVRWFDAEKDAGEIQLNGWSKVFRIGSEHLRPAGLRRLYRGQEVEAELVPGADGQLQVAGLQLIGPETETGDAAALPRSAVVTRRNRRAVTVELKTEALRRVGTRLQAERLFGRGGDLPN
jgi:cold shock CspA family protein